MPWYYNPLLKTWKSTNMTYNRSYQRASVTQEIFAENREAKGTSKGENGKTAKWGETNFEALILDGSVTKASHLVITITVTPASPSRMDKLSTFTQNVKSTTPASDGQRRFILQSHFAPRRSITECKKHLQTYA